MDILSSHIKSHLFCAAAAYRPCSPACYLCDWGVISAPIVTRVHFKWQQCFGAFWQPRKH